MSTFSTWNTQKIATKASNDFVLTKEELMAIFMQHVSVTSQNYDFVREQFEEIVNEIKIDGLNDYVEWAVEKGEKEVTLNLPAKIELPGEVETVDVQVDTNINFEFSKQADIKQYDITHNVTIDSKVVEETKNLPEEIRTSLEALNIVVKDTEVFDPITGQGDRISVNTQNDRLFLEVFNDPTDDTFKKGDDRWAMLVGEGNSPVKVGMNYGDFINNGYNSRSLGDIVIPEEKQIFAFNITDNKTLELLEDSNATVALYDTQAQNVDALATL